MISIRYSIPPPLISRYTSVISEQRASTILLSAGILLVLILASSKGGTTHARLPNGNGIHRDILPHPCIVSIHAPTKGATAAAPITPAAAVVSIHVPTRGTTVWRYNVPHPYPSFNPRSHEGNDMERITDAYQGFAFQSTFPRGERRLGSPQRTPLIRFNPRSHEGNDSATCPVKCYNKVVTEVANKIY